MRLATEKIDEMDRAGVAAYIAALSNDLASMARGQGLDTLGYLLDMARLEAEAHAAPPSKGAPVSAS